MSITSKQNKTFFILLKSPNFLTVFRMLATPVLILIIVILPQNMPLFRFIASAFFTVIAITDFLDGYIARKYQTTSEFGKCFDNIADKTLVIVSLIGLVYLGKVNILAVTLVVMREVIISGIREFLATSKRINIPVTFFAKIKTTLQMITIGCLFFGEKGGEFLNFSQYFFYISVLISLITMYNYIKLAKVNFDS